MLAIFAKVVPLVCIVAGGAVLMMLLADVPIRATLRRWRWSLRERKRSRTKHATFSFPGGVELRYSISLHDDPYDGERFNALCIIFWLFKDKMACDVGFRGGGSLYKTIWPFDSVTGGLLPCILVKSGGFVIVEAESCGQYLVLIEKARNPRNAEIMAHQILTPDGVEKTLPDGRIVRVEKGGETHLTLITTENSISAPASSMEEMAEFHRALVMSDVRTAVPSPL